MTKIAKLYQRLLVSPGGQLDFRDFERLLYAFGFIAERVRGSHRVYSHPRCDRLMVIQPRGKEAKPYQIRQFLDMIEEFGLVLEE